MLFYKMLGGGLIIFCGYMCGRGVCKREERKLRQVDAFIALISHIKDMIDRYLMPIDRILRDCDRELLLACGLSGEGESLEALFDGAELLLDSDICEGLRSFAEELGRGWRESQIKLCDHHLSRLTRERDRLCADLPRSRRAAMTLALAVSAGVTILLI